MMLRALAVLGLVVGIAAPAAAADTTGTVDPATGQWTLRDGTGRVSAFFYGNPGDLPFLGDWDCDGVDTPGLYRQSDGFAYLRNSNDSGVADVRFFFGNPGDVPVAGDWDGDGCDTLSVYRPSESRFFVIDRLGRDEGGLGAAEREFEFGNPGDAPFVGDFDGDGDDEVGLRRESTGFAYLRFTTTTGIADRAFFYGNPGDQVVAGDWDGDGDASVGIHRGASRRFFLNNANAATVADIEVAGGRCGHLPVAGDVGALAADAGAALATFASGFSSPLFLDAPAGDGRVFVVQRDGRVEVVAGCPQVRSTFLDIRDRVLSGGERGLLGLAFHPGFATNGRFFANYTDGSGASVVAEFPGGRVLLRVPQPASNHNGGMLAFGADGYLYVGMGDGGGGGDPFGNGQDPHTLLGTILRIDVDGAVPYAIPPGNPFAGGGGAPEVWAYGLRNPWRFSFDGARLYVGDVGQNAREEVDLLGPGDAGANLGWPIREGNCCYPTGGSCRSAGLHAPLLEYPHPQGCSVTGGYVYRGTAVPSLAGRYLFGDFCGGWVRSVAAAPAAAGPQVALFDGLGPIASFGTDGHGELYVVTLDGRIRTVVPGA